MSKTWEKTWQERREMPPDRVNDVRSAWERDYARIIHSAAFRRLQSKTQVLDLGQSDFYRTRLTHSMEVAQVSNGLLKFLIKQYQASPIAHALPDTHLLAAICLAHDLGHPPFGHGGEVALNLCMREHGGFEGNGQTVRILSFLEQYTAKFGLNPTRRLLLGVLKYPAPYSELVNEKAYTNDVGPERWLFQTMGQKPPKCYHDTETEVIDWVLDPLGSDRKDFCATAKPKNNKGEQHKKTKYMSLDASIMNIADDVSYSLHDLEDATSIGMLTRDMWDDFIMGKEDVFKNCELTSHEVAADLFGTESYKRKSRIGALVHYLITHSLIEESGIKATCPLISYTAKLAPHAAKLQKLMGDLVLKHVIWSPNVQMQEFRGRKMVVELFDVFATDPQKLLPLDVQKIYVNQDSKSACMRVVCDFIACMTDAQAARLHEKLFYAGKGSVFDKF